MKEGYNLKDQLGLIHIICGDGNGKTTSSIGIIMRALGQNYKVVLVQFLKDGNSSEILSLSQHENISIITGKDIKGFTKSMNNEELDIITENHNNHLMEAIEMCLKEEINLLVLDEVIDAINYNLIDPNILYNFIKNKPKNLEIILTGRNPDDFLLENADYVSEIKKVKHPYDKGILARRGIDW